MGIERYVDGTICGVKFQKSGYVEGSLDFAILALCDDGLSRDRLMGGEGGRDSLGQSNEVTIGGGSAHVHRYRTIRRLENE